jgi:catechol 2,3-dioxygenase-like lactoylglutathione lyase family enzyme
MLSHICLGTNHLGAALAFYNPVLATLGLVLKFSDEAEGMAGWMSPLAPRPLFIVCKPYNGLAATTGNGAMVALLAPDHDTVRRAHATALQHGGQCEGPPGPRPHYHPHYYGAYFRDPEGNKLCVCCHEPQTA